MEITSDVLLKGLCWTKSLDLMKPFFPTSSQPNYSLYALSIAVGIMYDKQLDIAGDEVDDIDLKRSVPRTVLHPHSSDLDFLFQTAIISSSLVDFDEKDRIALAFDPECKIKFNKIEFLTKFANFGVTKLYEKLSSDPIETMEKLKNFLAQSIEGYNYELDEIDDTLIDVEDLD